LVKGQVGQGQFRIYLEPGNTNLGDYVTKHHPPCHPKRVRPVFQHTEHSPVSLQGCIELLACHMPKATRGTSVLAWTARA
jgi:hypothetical protein